jgi:transposase
MDSTTPWHRGDPIKEVLAAHSHVRLYRLPSYSPQLNVMERFWRKLRRRATHNRLLEHMAALRKTLRQNLCYFQTIRAKVLSMLEEPRKKKQI